ncbi:MAG TPA: translation initiation factor IF-2 [Magnetospirillaceae bacterium]|jgi:translation initiation factor IF-2
MADTNTPIKRTPGKLELKKTVETGQVRQSFSHGRSKVVTVEVKKKRTFAQGAGGVLQEVKELPRAPEVEVAPAPEVIEAARAHLHDLTTGEKAARARALQDALETQRVEEEARKNAPPPAVEEPVAPASEPAPQTAAPAVAAASTAEASPEAKAKTDAKAKTVTPVAGARAVVAEEEEEGPARPRRTAAHRPPAATKRAEPRRREGKLTVTAALDEDDRSERGRSLAAVKRARERERQKQIGKPAEKVLREVTIPETITVQELANRMAERSVDVIKSLMKMGVMATINQPIDADTAELVVAEFGHTAKRVSEADIEVGLGEHTDEDVHLVARPPVVTVMGHVDHGKTSLLDALRSTDVAAGEAGGITQHIGAYQVTLAGGQHITFIDTPGHEAFTAMRARGAQATDIVVLVVAADDGIMPQTVEAIRHARAAKAPIIVAINKIDKPGANAQKVRQELLQHELVTEELGGDILAVEVSAKNKTNLDKLEEAILLQAEILDLKANPERASQGVVIEAKMERGRGTVATVLVQKGTLRSGDLFVAGSEWGRVRALYDDRGNKVEEAGPAMPVEVLGLQGTPAAGDDFIVVDTEARAREVADYRQRKEREAKVAASVRGTLDQMFSKISTGEAKDLPVVVKGDVQGSVEAIASTLEKLGNDSVKVRVLHAAVGGINESDITLAKASGALVIGFNVRANPQAREMSRRDGIEIRYYSIIYDLSEDVKKALTGMLAPTLRERFLGNAEIREVFSISKIGRVAGCMVTEGQIKRGGKVRLLRDNVVIYEGALGQLKRFKDDVREVREGYECGVSLENYNDIQKGDVIECFEMEEVAGVL